MQFIHPLVQGPRLPQLQHMTCFIKVTSQPRLPELMSSGQSPKELEEKGQRAWPLLEGDFQEEAEASPYSTART